MPCWLLQRFHLLGSVVIFCCLLMFSGCQKGQETSEQPASTAVDVAEVIVTSEPLLEIARSLCGDSVSVRRIVPDNVSSRNWKPSREDIAAMQQCRAILISGASYEPWKNRVTLPGSRVHDTAAGYYQQLIVVPDAVVHQHGPEGRHTHAGTLWATWLDPELLSSQVSRAAESLASVFPDQKSRIETESARIKHSIEPLLAMIADLNAAASGKEIHVVADSPVYQYLTNRLGWKLHYLHWEDAAAPDAEQREEIQSLLKSAPGLNGSIFLLSTRHTEETARFVESAGFTVVRIDLCEFPADPPSPLTERLKANIERLKAAVSEVNQHQSVGARTDESRTYESGASDEPAG